MAYTSKEVLDFLEAKANENNNPQKVRMAAAIIDEQWRIYSFGVNQRKTHPRSNTPFQFMHAEFHALLSMSKQTPYLLHSKGMQVVVIRIRKDRKYGLAKPCIHCMELLKRFGVERALWTDNDGRLIMENL